MESLKRNYDRVLLAVAALVALVFGGMMAMKALGLSKQFNRAEAPERAVLGDSGEEAVATASNHLDNRVNWLSPPMPGVPQKPLPLLVSVPVYVQNGAEIDLLDPASPKIRPPIDNAYIFDHRLPGGRSDLLELDFDDDGFNTLEEWSDGKTDPRDKESHPPFTSKLKLADVKTDRYTLSYRTGSDPAGDFSIREETELFPTIPPRPVPRKKSHFKTMNKPFGDHPGHEDRYQITGFQHKMVPGGAGGAPQPAHIITISDAKGAPFTIDFKDSYILPTHYAVFHYALPGFNQPLAGAFKVGDVFELPGDPGTKYKVLELSGKVEDGAMIQQLPAPGGTPKDLKILPLQKID